MDEVCTPHFLISPNGLTVHPANLIQECNLSANSVNVQISVLFIRADRGSSALQSFGRRKYKMYSTQTAASLTQFANSVV